MVKKFGKKQKEKKVTLEFLILFFLQINFN